VGQAFSRRFQWTTPVKMSAKHRSTTKSLRAQRHRGSPRSDRCTSQTGRPRLPQCIERSRRANEELPRRARAPSVSRRWPYSLSSRQSPPVAAGPATSGQSEEQAPELNSLHQYRGREGRLRANLIQLSSPRTSRDARRPGPPYLESRRISLPRGMGRRAVHSNGASRDKARRPTGHSDFISPPRLRPWLAAPCSPFPPFL